MKSTFKKWCIAAGLLAITAVPLLAQDSALVEALVKKGILTNQEAEEIRTDLVKEYQKTGGGKIELGNHITKLKIYGDARLRYQYNQQETQVSTGDTNIPQSRARYRLRIGAEYKFTDHFEGGFQLESATANDSANQSFGSGYGKFGINVGLIYLKYNPTDWVSLIAGKQKNSFYTTDLVWDNDINPEGATEIFTWKVNDCTTVDFLAGQFYYSDNAENNTAAAGNTDVWQFYEQAKVTYKPTKDVSIIVAPGVLTYSAGSTTPWAGTLTSAPGYSNVDGANNLNLILFPGEVKWKVCDLPIKAYWDFSWNTEGQQRVQQTFGAVANTSLEDDIAWLVGLKVGDNKKKGDWSADVNFRTVGLGAVDPNLNDSDFGLGFVNQQGVKVSGTYSFTDSVSGTVSYYDSWHYKEDLNIGQMGSGGTVTNASNARVLQVDLNWKF
ncbi:MAG: putative porin [Candidatus Methylacidiphilales bacterium]